MKSKKKNEINISFRQIWIWFRKYVFRFFVRCCSSVLFCFSSLIASMRRAVACVVFFVLVLYWCGPYESVFCTFVYAYLSEKKNFSFSLDLIIIFIFLCSFFVLYLLFVVIERQMWFSFCSFKNLTITKSIFFIFFDFAFSLPLSLLPSHFRYSFFLRVV